MLLNPFMMKWDSEKDHLELEAKPGESLLIKNVLVIPTGPVKYTKFMIDRMMVGYFHTYTIYDNQIWYMLDNNPCEPLLTRLTREGLFKGYPIASGQTFIIDVAGAGSRQARILYERHDEGDIIETMENGTKSDTYIFVNYGTNAAVHETGSYALIDKTLNPAEFPDFPFGAVVPAGMKISIYGIMIPHRQGDVILGSEMRRIRLIKGREILWDPDKDGIICSWGANYFPWGGQNQNINIQLLPEPIVFLPGEELTVQVYIVTDDEGDCAADDYLVGLIQKVEAV